LKKTKKSNLSNSGQPAVKFKIPDNLLFLLFGIFLCLLTTFKISGDDDIFWHLKTGEYIENTHVVPSTDVFGSVTNGQQWIPFEWGWDLLNYCIYSTGGFTAVIILKTLLFVLMFYFYFQIVKELNFNTSLSILLLVLLSIGIIDRLQAKPQQMSYLFMTAMLYILIHFSRVNRNTRKIYFIPLIFLIWVNMHMGVLAGAVLLTIFFISELFIYFRQDKFSISKKNPPDKKTLLRFGIIYVASVLVMMVNPHGFYTFTYVNSHLHMKMMDEIIEWYSPFTTVFRGSVYEYIYILFLAGGVITLYYSYKQKDIFTGLVMTVFILFSLQTARYSFDYMVISVIFIIMAGDYFIRNSNSVKLKEFLTAGPALSFITAAVIILGIVLLPSNKLYSLIHYERTFGYGMEEKDYPVKAADFIKKNNINHIGSNLFNVYDCGGYLMWDMPGTKTFIDSRGLNDDIYYSFKTIYRMMPGFEQKFDSYNFDYIVWYSHYATGGTTDLQTTIISYLLKKPDKWKLVYWDDYTTVLVKNEEKFKDVIAANEYKYVNPYYFIYYKEPLVKATYEDNQRIIEEIRRNTNLDPNGTFINKIAKAFKVPIGK
jgi:hypothetical protein